MQKIFSRQGDGWAIELTEAELMQDIVDGSSNAAADAGIAPLSDDDITHLFDICKNVHKISGVERGCEVITTFDGPTIEIRHAGIIANRQQALQIFERCLGADTIEFSHVDYSYKPAKTVVHEDLPLFEQSQLLMVIPLFYGAMPNLGLYTYPDGPMPNPMDLLPQGKIKEACEAYENAVELAVKDMVYVASAFHEAGADGINFDTVGASGDPDFKAALIATEILKEKYPDICIEIGMAGEFVLGTHGELSHFDRRLAGLFPHQQIEIAEKAGATIFGPAVNTVPKKSIPWNLSRAITMTKACVEIAGIPVHANMGMGVGGLPICETLPVDMVSVASKAMVEITRLDGL
jgi:dimethylamine---corrinoid protein Co-methyltransferase